MLASLVCLALLTTDPAPMETVRRLYDLRDVLPVMTEEAPGFRTLPLSPRWDDDLELYNEEGYMFEIDLLVDLLRQTVAPEEWEYEGRSLEVLGDDNETLAVVAPVSVQKDIARFLAYVSRAANSPIEVVFRVYSTGGVRGRVDLPLGKLDEREIQEIEKCAAAGRLEHVRSFRLRMHSGVPQSAKDIVRTSYLRDYDVEIAQAATIPGPVIDSYPEGVALLARADRDIEDSILVTFGLRRSWSNGPLLEMNALTTSSITTQQEVEQVRVGGRLQSPQVSFTTLATSVRLRPGDATSVMMSTLGEDGPGEGTFVVIRVGQVAQAPAAFESGDRYLSIRDVGGHYAPGWPNTHFSEHAMRFPHEFVDEERRFPKSLTLGPISGDHLSQIDSILSEVADKIEEEHDEYVSIGTANNFLYVVGDRDGGSRAMSRMLALLPRGFTSAGVSGSLAAVDQQGGKKVQLFAFPTGAGGGFAVGGSQETYILNYDVEVATNSSIFDPQVEAIVSGWALRFQTAGMLDGRGALHLRAQSHLRTNERQEIPAMLSGMAGVYLPAFRSSAADGHLRGTDSSQFVEMSLPTGPSMLLVERLD